MSIEDIIQSKFEKLSPSYKTLNAALKIQATYRGFLKRKLVNRFKEAQHDVNKQEEALNKAKSKLEEIKLKLGF